MEATGDARHDRSPEEVSRRYTIYLVTRRIPPGRELEEIAT